MKKTLISSAILALFASQALAVSGIYVAPKVGWSGGEISDFDINFPFSSGSALEADLKASKGSSNTNAVGWGGAVGYKYDSLPVPLRMETEYLYRNHYTINSEFHPSRTGGGGFLLGTQNFENGDYEAFSSTVDSQTILANFYLDIPVTKMFALFVGAGLGAALNYSDSSLSIYGIDSDFIGSADGKDHDYAFSWMGTAGVTVNPLEWLAIDLSYRYSDLGDVSYRIDNAVAPSIVILGGESSLSAYDSELTAQEVYLGFRFMIPDFYKKPEKKHVKHQYIDK